MTRRARRERHRIHAEFFGLRHELIDLGKAVKKGIMGMGVKMNEFTHMIVLVMLLYLDFWG